MPVSYKPNPRSHTVIISRSAEGRPDYICDGTNDHVQIQQAIDSLSSNGGRILIRKGTYNIGATLTINFSHLIIQGEGFDTILKANTSLNDYIVTFDSSSAAIFGVSIRDMMLDGDATNQTDGGCIDAEGAVHCEFSFLRIYRPYHNGIHIRGIVAGGGSFGHHNRIVNCLFDHGDDSSGDGRGMRFNSSDENFIYGCDFENNHDGILDEVGINTIQQCSFVGGGRGVYALFCSRVHVINCYFDGVDNHNIHLRGSHHQIIGNNFFNVGDGSTSNTTSGIYIESGDKCVISNNNMQSASTAGKTRSLIRDDSTGHNIIIGNNLDQDGSFGTSITEITPSNNLVINNRGVGGCTTKTSNYTVTSSDDVVLVNTSGGSVTITLPTAIDFKKLITIKKISSSNTLNISTTLSQTIDGSTSISITVQYESLTLSSDGSNWFVI